MSNNENIFNLIKGVELTVEDENGVQKQIKIQSKDSILFFAILDIKAPKKNNQFRYHIELDSTFFTMLVDVPALDTRSSKEILKVYLHDIFGEFSNLVCIEDKNSWFVLIKDKISYVTNTGEVVFSNGQTVFIVDEKKKKLQ